MAPPNLLVAVIQPYITYIVGRLSADLGPVWSQPGKPTLGADVFAWSALGLELHKHCKTLEV